jgi:hypothetical protein
MKQYKIQNRSQKNSQSCVPLNSFSSDSVPILDPPSWDEKGSKRKTLVLSSQD